jgi:hypothetical protein
MCFLRRKRIVKAVASRERDPNDGRRWLTKEARSRLPAGRKILRQGNVEMTKRFMGTRIRNISWLIASHARQC